MGEVYSTYDGMYVNGVWMTTEAGWVALGGPTPIPAPIPDRERNTVLEIDTTSTTPRITEV